MNSVIPAYQPAGLIFSIVALTFVVPVVLMYRHYFRSLDFLQMSYIFSLTMYAKCFSSNLSVSIFSFNHNFLTFCESGDLVCTLGFQLSFGVVVLGIILLFGLLIVIKKCTGNISAQFEPMYLFFKGFFRFIFLPMAYSGTISLVSILKQGEFNKHFISAVVIVGFCVIFPLVQLIGYKLIQLEQPKFSIWVKWLEFFSYYRLLITAALLALFKSYDDVIYLHCAMIALLLYPVVFIWKGQFTYPLAQRIIAGLGEAAFLANFYLFKYHTQAIQKYDTDFFLLGFVLLLDTFLYLIRTILVGCYGVKAIPKVDVQLNQSNQRLDNHKKGNKYDAVQNIQTSKIDSPRKKR